MRRKILVIGFVAALSAGIAAVMAETEPQAAQLSIEQVKDNLYNIIGSGGNVAALVTSEGVILVDDKFEQNYEAIVENVRSVTDQPIRYVINTHYHADHSGGNSRFLPVAEVLSTQNARTNILEGLQSNAPPGVMPARITFTEQASIFLGGQEVRARHFGRQPHQQRRRHLLPRTGDRSHGRHDGGRDAADRLQRRWQHRRVDRNRGRDDGRVRLRHGDSGTWRGDRPRGPCARTGTTWWS